MKKKYVGIILLGLVFITGCNAGVGGNSDFILKESKNKVANLSIENVSYIDPIGDEIDSTFDYILIDVDFKNTSDEKLYVNKEDFYLFENGQIMKLNPLDVEYENEIKRISDKLEPNKSSQGRLVFKIESKKSYTLGMSARGKDQAGNSYRDIEIPLDTAKYQRTKNAVGDPKLALEAYFDVVFLQKNNPNYQTKVQNDAEKERQKLQEKFEIDLNERMFIRFKPASESIEKTYKEYIENQRKKAKLEVIQKGNTGEKAVFEINFTGISRKSVKDLISDQRRKYELEKKNEDTKKSEQFAFSNLDEIYKNADTGKMYYPVEIILTKKEGKWLIDSAEDDYNEMQELIDAFIGDVK